MHAPAGRPVARRLRAADQVDPVAVLSPPRLTWVSALDGGSGELRLRVWSAGAPEDVRWDTQVDAGVTGVVYAGSPLAPARRYCWSLADPRSDLPEVTAEFRTAPATFPQVGRWITVPAGVDADEPVFATTVVVPQGSYEIVLHLLGLGLAVVLVDGTAPDDRRLAPAVSAYHKTSYYESYDLSGLAPGEHQLAVTLGRGFFALPTPNVWGWHTAPWTGPLRLVADLEVVDASGARTVSGSDPSWTVSAGATVSNCLYAGESYDATRLPPTPQRAVTTEGPGGRLAPRAHPPVRPSWTGDVTWTRVGESWVGDAGRTVAGWVRLCTAQAYGTEVRITYAEALEPDGRVQPVNPHVDGDRFQRDEYVGDGRDDQRWEPRYTYKGFRYVQLDGLTHDPRADTVIAVQAHTDVERIGTFASSEPLFERYVEAMARSVVNNLHHLPTDTPMYEKNGWTGNAQVGALCMLNLFDCGSLLAKWLDDARDAQQADGALPVIIPTPGWGFSELAPAPEWTTVYPYLLRELYRYRGDEELLDRHWESLQRYLEWELGQLVNGLGVSHLGDYLAPGTLGNGPDDPVLTASAFLVRALRSGAEVAELLPGRAGTGESARRWRTEAAALSDRVTARCLNPDRDAYVVGDGYSQTANAVALEFGLVPDDAVASVAARLAADVVSRDGHHDVGCLGAAALLTALTRNGYPDLAIRVATNRSYPGWGFWLDHGADTMWEMWEETTRSRDHYFHGTVVQWLIQDVAGLRCGDHGWATFDVRPAVLQLDHARFAVDTVRGRVSVAWRHDHDGLRLDVRVPPGSTASLALPGSKRSLGPGRWELALPLELPRPREVVGT